MEQRIIKYFLLSCWITGLVAWSVAVYSSIALCWQIKKGEKWRIFLDPFYILKPELYTEKGNKLRKRVFASVCIFLLAVLLFISVSSKFYKEPKKSVEAYKIEQLSTVEN